MRRAFSKLCHVARCDSRKASGMCANQWSKRQGYGGISKQIWNIRPKIKEIDRAIAPADQARVYEAHPELAFARINGGKPLDSKHTPEGLDARKRLLVREGFTNLDNWLQELRGKGAKADDLFDACVLVLTARNILRGQAKHLPEVVERDSRGLTDVDLVLRQTSSREGAKYAERKTRSRRQDDSVRELCDVRGSYWVAALASSRVRPGASAYMLATTFLNSARATPWLRDAGSGCYFFERHRLTFAMRTHRPSTLTKAVSSHCISS